MRIGILVDEGVFGMEIGVGDAERIGEVDAAEDAELGIPMLETSERISIVKHQFAVYLEIIYESEPHIHTGEDVIAAAGGAAIGTRNRLFVN